MIHEYVLRYDSEDKEKSITEIERHPRFKYVQPPMLWGM